MVAAQHSARLFAPSWTLDEHQPQDAKGGSRVEGVGFFPAPWSNLLRTSFITLFITLSDT